MNNGWNKYQKKAGSIRFSDMYKNQLVVIIGGGKSKYMYLSDALYKALGYPDRVEILTRGSNIGLVKSENIGSFAITKSEGATRYISATRLAREYNLQEGAYVAHIEAGDIAVFDTQYPPSAITHLKK